MYHVKKTLPTDGTSPADVWSHFRIDLLHTKGNYNNDRVVNKVPQTDNQKLKQKLD